nr:DUF2630 family protein [Gordonia oryzae]
MRNVAAWLTTFQIPTGPSSHIAELIGEERELRERLGRGDISNREENPRLRALEVDLDQCWDLLRQLQARRHAVQSPGDNVVPLSRRRRELTSRPDRTRHRTRRRIPIADTDARRTHPIGPDLPDRT